MRKHYAFDNQRYSNPVGLLVIAVIILFSWHVSTLFLPLTGPIDIILSWTSYNFTCLAPVLMGIIAIVITGSIVIVASALLAFHLFIHWKWQKLLTTLNSVSKDSLGTKLNRLPVNGVEVTSLPFVQPSLDSNRLLNDPFLAGPVDRPYQYVHWLALHKKVREVTFEVSINTDIRIRFWVPNHEGSNDLDLLCSSMQTNNPHLEFEQAPSSAIFDILGTNRSEGVVHKEAVKFGDQYISVILIKGAPGATIEGTQIDRLIHSIIEKEIRASFIVNFRSSKQLPKEHGGDENKNIIRSQKWPANLRTEEELVNEDSVYGFWNISAYLVIRGEEIEAHLLKVNRAKIILETIFLNPIQPIQTTILKGHQLRLALPKVVYRKGLTRTGLVSSRQLSYLVHFPQDAQPGYVRKHSPVFELPPQQQREINLFHVMKGDRVLYKTGIDLIHFTTHMIVVGQTGKGKTRFVGNLIKQIQTLTDIGITIFDWKGEYTGITQTVFRIGRESCPLRINLFETHGLKNIEQYVQSLVALFRELLRSDTESILSSQMERILRESLIEYLSRGPGNYTEYEQFLTKWIIKNSRRFSNPESSTAGLINRFGTLFRGRLGYIFNTSKTTVSFNSLLKDRICFDLSHLVAYNKDDARLFLNALLMVIRTYLFQSFSHRLRYLVVAEEAHYLVPEVFTKRSSAEASPIEDIALFQRAYGAGLIAITTRPSLISRNILANSGTKIFFQCPLDANLVGDLINLSSEQKQFLSLMPERVVIAHLPWFEHPFKAKTVDFDFLATIPDSKRQAKPQCEVLLQRDSHTIDDEQAPVTSLNSLERHFLDKVCTAFYKEKVLHRIFRINNLLAIDIPRQQVLTLFIENPNQFHLVDFQKLTQVYSSIILICPPSSKPTIQLKIQQDPLFQLQKTRNLAQVHLASLTQSDIKNVITHYIKKSFFPSFHKPSIITKPRTSMTLKASDS